MTTIDYTDLNALAQRVYKANEKWWQDPVTKEKIERNKGELLMLVITELAEACEGERKNLMDDKLPHRKMAEVEMVDAYIRILDFSAGFSIPINIDRTVTTSMYTNKGEELLYLCRIICAIRFPQERVYWSSDISKITENLLISMFVKEIEGYCKWHGYDLYGAFEEKMAYNATREDHKHESRLQAGGKQW